MQTASLSVYRNSALDTNALVAPNVPGATSFRKQVNQLGAIADQLGRYGGGVFGIPDGPTKIVLTAPGSGLSLGVSAGHAMIGGPVEIPTATTIAVPDNTARVWIWLLQTGAALTYTTSTTKPAGECCLLGSCVTSGGNITSVDYSGVVYIRGGIGVRGTADDGTPSDTPPSTVNLITQTGFCSYYWDGAVHAQQFIPRVSTDPANPGANDVWYNTTAAQLKVGSTPVAAGAPASAHYLTSQAESGLSAEVNLGALTTGLLKIAVTGSVATPSTAISGTDYDAAGAAAAAQAASQPLDSDLTTIAGLTATTNNFLQSKSSAWASRTPTQVTADLITAIGDSGSGGTKGLVPAAGAGDTAAGKFLKADMSYAVPSSGPSTLLYSNQSIPAALTSTSETAFGATYTIGANVLTAGDLIVVKLAGVYSGTVLPTIEVKLKFGSVALIDTTAITGLVTGSNLPWFAEIRLIVQSPGVFPNLPIKANASLQFATAATAALSILDSTAPTSIDVTSSQAVTVTVQWGAGGTGQTITLEQMSIQRLSI